MKLSIPEEAHNKVVKDLQKANRAFQKKYPGDKHARQPVHTVYGGADLFTHNIAQKLGKAALNSFNTYAPNFSVFARVYDLPGWEGLPKELDAIQKTASELSQMATPDRRKYMGWLHYEVYCKVLHKLETEPVEDFRIDFEDGFGNRSDEEEDNTAINAAIETAKGMHESTLPPFIGIRIKPFTEDLKERGIRTLDIYVSTLLQTTGGKLPDNFVVMLPKVTIPNQVTALAKLFDALEDANDLTNGTFNMEIMVETTQSIMSSEGKNSLMEIVKASKGRCIACHFGTYDYTASCNITAKYQTMAHPVCDFAHHMTRVALGGTGIWLSDGATNVMPVGPHRGNGLNQEQLVENARVVHRAWKMGYDHIRHSLWNGFYQGWDLNPAQLPTRYAAVYSFFLESYEDAADRLRRFVDRAAQATLTGDVFDDAATGQGLLNYFLSAVNCGAITEEDTKITGLTLDEIRSRSFLKILEGRRKNSS
ncbi:MAG: phosphoenolpyruvate kinase [Bacteroidetes bacterium]|nr:phosphoenolpyruvate kinase [Bacteroidia bacterium]PCH68985.1 MAG: phosphoenolpyruvate kinase [Bacteroidota bacterium]